MLEVYYKIEKLSDELRVGNKIKSEERLDCTMHTNNKGYEGMKPFKNKKGQMFFSKRFCKDFVKANTKRLAECSLTGQGLNLSSLYGYTPNCEGYAYGYPNPKRVLSNGEPNPLFEYRDDLYLFYIRDGFNTIEIFVIPNGRSMATSHYQTFIDNEYNEEMDKLREQATEFYPYCEKLL